MLIGIFGFDEQQVSFYEPYQVIACNFINAWILYFSVVYPTPLLPSFLLVATAPISHVVSEPIRLDKARDLGRTEISHSII